MSPADAPSEDALGEVLIEPDQLERRVAELGAEISRDYEGGVLLIGILKGAVLFLADLMRSMHVPCEIDFMAVSSYGSATDSSGVVRILKDLESSIEGRDVVIVEDIIDSGLTLHYCALLDERERRRVDLPIRYVGFEIPDRFVVGYGLDYQQRFRNLGYVAVLADEHT